MSHNLGLESLQPLIGIRRHAKRSGWSRSTNLLEALVHLAELGRAVLDRLDRARREDALGRLYVGYGFELMIQKIMICI